MTKMLFPMAMGLSTLVSPALASEPLPMPLAQRLSVVVVMPRSGLGYGTAYLGTSPDLLFALSDFERIEAKSHEFAPLRERVEGYPYEQRIEQALRAKLTGEAVAPDLDIHFVEWTPQSSALKTLVAGSKEIMVILPHFAIDPYFRFLTVDLVVAVEDARSDGSLAGDVRFIRRYSIFFQLIDKKGADRERRWMAMGGERLTAMLDQGIALTTDMLAYDFSSQGRSEWKDWGKMRTLEVRGVKTWAYPIRQTGTYMLTRAGRNWYLGWEPVDEEDPTIVPEH